MTTRPICTFGLIHPATSTMPISVAQTAAIKEVIQVILNQTVPRGKRQLAAMFMDLVDRQEWPQYYEVRLPLIYIIMQRIYYPR